MSDFSASHSGLDLRLRIPKIGGDMPKPAPIKGFSVYALETLSHKGIQGHPLKPAPIKSFNATL